MSDESEDAHARARGAWEDWTEEDVAAELAPLIPIVVRPDEEGSAHVARKLRELARLAEQGALSGIAFAWTLQVEMELQPVGMVLDFEALRFGVYTDGPPLPEAAAHRLKASLEAALKALLRLERYDRNDP